MKTMIRKAQGTACPASAIPIEHRKPEDVVDAGVKSAVSSEDTVAFLVYACNTVPIIKPIVIMFLRQFIQRNSGGDE